MAAPIDETRSSESGDIGIKTTTDYNTLSEELSAGEEPGYTIKHELDPVEEDDNVGPLTYEYEADTGNIPDVKLPKANRDEVMVATSHSTCPHVGYDPIIDQPNKYEYVLPAMVENGPNLQIAEVKEELEYNIKTEDVNDIAESSDSAQSAVPIVHYTEMQSGIDSDKRFNLRKSGLPTQEENTTDIRNEQPMHHDEQEWYDSTATETVQCIDEKPSDLIRCDNLAISSEKKSSSDCLQRNMMKSSEDLSTDRLQPRKTPDKAFSCPYCELKCQRKGHLNNHIRTHTGEKPFPCSHCNKRYRSEHELSYHIRIHTDEIPFSCPDCDKKYYDKRNLKKHVIRNHVKTMPYCCAYCDKSFPSKSELARHIRHHTGEAPFLCTYCGKGFKQRFQLTKHIRIHTGEKPFPCPHCEKSFNIKSNLKTHIWTHTGEAPFSCTYCEKVFRQKGPLSRHIRTHTGERPFPCPHCEKSFTVKSSLTTHMRIHTDWTPFACPHCQKICSHADHLKIHIRSHTGEAPFSCPHCNKRFSARFSLTRHIATHTAETYSCSQCNKMYKSKNNLTKHIQTNHG